MEVEDLIKLWRDYCAWVGHYGTKNFAGFMEWLEKEYWLSKPSKGVK